jgi:hypothetical protein
MSALKSATEIVMTEEPPKNVFDSIKPPLGRHLLTAIADLHSDLIRDQHLLFVSIDKICRQAYTTGPRLPIMLPADVLAKIPPALIEEIVGLWNRWQECVKTCAENGWEQAIRHHQKLRDEFNKHPDVDKGLPHVDVIKRNFRLLRDSLVLKYRTAHERRLTQLRIELCQHLAAELERVVKERVETEAADAAAHYQPLVPSKLAWAMSWSLNRFHQSALRIKAIQKTQPADLDTSPGILIDFSPLSELIESLALADGRIPIPSDCEGLGYTPEIDPVERQRQQERRQELVRNFPWPKMARPPKDRTREKEPN